MSQQIDINQLLQIIGAKEVEIQILRERIQQLEQEKQNKSRSPEPCGTCAHEVHGMCEPYRQGMCSDGQSYKKKESKPLQTDPVE